MTEQIQPPKIVAPLDIKDEARPHSKTGGDIEWPKTPPAEESIAACVESGLLVPAGQYEYRKPGEPMVLVQGYKTGPSNANRHRQQWGECEMRQLVKILWPDIPKVGVSFELVIERAKQAAAALRHIKTYSPQVCESTFD